MDSKRELLAKRNVSSHNTKHFFIMILFYYTLSSNTMNIWPCIIYFSRLLSEEEAAITGAKISDVKISTFAINVSHH